MRNLRKSFMVLATVCFFIFSILLSFINVKVNAYNFIVRTYIL